jgi:hypothetical protein
MYDTGADAKSLAAEGQFTMDITMKSTVPLSRVPREVATKDRMPTDTAVRRALHDRGLVKVDQYGRQCVTADVVAEMKRTYSASGFLFPRRQKGVA